VLLVGEAGSGKTGVLRDVAEEFGTSVINVNLALSSELLELTAKQRSLRLPGILDQIVDKAQSPVVLDGSIWIPVSAVRYATSKVKRGLSRPLPRMRT
jgi:cytidylate kinase